MEPGLLKSADWPLAIDLYFFLGGIAGGAFVIATVAYLLDGRRYRDAVRAGYYIAFHSVFAPRPASAKGSRWTRLTTVPPKGSPWSFKRS